jgi:hypothetical protein
MTTPGFKVFIITTESECSEYGEELYLGKF